MEKKVVIWHGKEYYLLGKRKMDGKYLYLEKAHFDCGWYWGFGYVEGFTNNKNPEKSRDISSHEHIDSLLFNKNMNGFDAFKELFEETPMTDKELWKFLELMKSFYVAKEYSEMLYIGGAHYTQNPVSELIKNDDEYTRINTIILPKVFEEVYKLLS